MSIRERKKNYVRKFPSQDPDPAPPGGESIIFKIQLQTITLGQPFPLRTCVAETWVWRSFFRHTRTQICETVWAWVGGTTHLWISSKAECTNRWTREWVGPPLSSSLHLLSSSRPDYECTLPPPPPGSRQIGNVYTDEVWPWGRWMWIGQPGCCWRTSSSRFRCCSTSRRSCFEEDHLRNETGRIWCAYSLNKTLFGFKMSKCRDPRSRWYLK